MNILLFDVDGTLVESGKNISKDQITILKKLQTKYKIGVVGGGKLNKILEQTNGIIFDYYFTECGSVYHMIDSDYKLIKVHEENIRNHELYLEINNLVKISLKFLSQVSYTITGHFIDLRNGLIYISMIGMSATDEEREYFKDIDKRENIREKLINILNSELIKKQLNNKISVNVGGSVGIAIFPTEFDKVQVLKYFNENDNISYFGDKYDEGGNDYTLINHERVTGYKIDNIEQTYEYLISDLLSLTN